MTVRDNSQHDTLTGAGWDVGRVVAGRYRLRAVLGAGAMGVVWQADDLRLDREVALKQLRLRPGLTPESAARARQRVFREGRIAARLQHPHAVAVIDVTTDDANQPLLVLEFLPSQSLHTILTEHGPLPPALVARIGAAVASALASAHAAGVVHRDVKPGNILLADGWIAKITDFGLSHVVGDAGDGLVVGTPVFLSPQAAMGQPPSPASDVFSLGATLYAAVEGRPPFGKADSPEAQLERVAAGQAPPPLNAGPLTQVLTCMLLDDPADRPTMAQVADTLAAIAEGGEIDDATGLLPEYNDATGILPEYNDATGILPEYNDATGVLPAVDDETGAFPAVEDATGVLPAIDDDTGSFAVVDAEDTLDDMDPVAPPDPVTPKDPVFPAPRPARRRLRYVVLALLAIALIVFFAVGRPPEQTDTPITPPTTSAVPPATTSTVQQGSSIASTPPSTVPGAEAPAEPAALQKLVTDYYGLLPGQPAQAWTLLSPDMQQDLDRAQYDSFWASVRNLQVRPAPAVNGDLVVVEIEYTQEGRGRIQETHQHAIVARDGVLLINSDQLLSTEDIGGPGPGGPPGPRGNGN